jgi:hypothetical protein
VGGEQGVVDQLDPLAGAERADVQDGVGVAGQRGADLLESGRGAAGEQGEAGGRDVVRAAADRGVDNRDPERGGASGDVLGGARAPGGVDHQDGALRHRVEQAAGQAGLLDLLVGEDADQDGDRAFGGFGDAGDGVRAFGGQGGAFVLGPG